MDSKDNLSSSPVSLPHPNKLLVIEALDYNNPYDFHKPHRHDYFEIILVKDGSGRQYIDFSGYDIAAGQVYTVYPGQVHQMQRNTAEGLVIQFKKNIFEFIHPVGHHDLYFPMQPANCDSATFQHLFDLASRIQTLLQTAGLSASAIQKAYSYLQIILITLPELYPQSDSCHGQPVIDRFLLLITQNIRTVRKVSEYCALMGLAPEKLNAACKTCLGKTALELIHEELLLEIRRLMVLNQLSLKEIAYELNFDSPANFSGFIKAHTAQTPSGLQADILQIYK